MQRGSLVSIRVRAADPAWLCIIHWSLCTTKSIKAFLENKEMGQFLRNLAPPASTLSPFFSLSLPLFFRLIPWNTEALCIHFSAQASKTHARGSQRWGHPPLFKWAPVALHIDGASFLSWDLISFPCKPRNISLFSPLLFHYIILP